MSNQRSIVHHFFPPNVEVVEKSFFRKSCSFSKNLHKTILKTINFCSYNICMGHQRSIVHFFALNIQVLEKSFLRKSCCISKN